MDHNPTPPAEKTPATGWVSMRHLQHIALRGKAAGIGIDDLLTQAGLATHQLTDADSMVPLPAIETLLATLQRQYEDPLMGLHLASEIQPATFGALGYVLQACTTFADLLDVVVRYNGLMSNIGRTSIEHGPGVVELRWECLAGSPLFRRHASEYVLGSFAMGTRLLAQDAAPQLSAVHFAHPRPENQERIREYFAFFRCPVHFDRPFAAIILPASHLQTRLPNGDAAIKDILEQHTQYLLSQRGQTFSLVDDVHRLIEALMLDGIPTKEMVAQQLGTSSRSLHRRLQEAGTGYRDILDAVRLEQAHERLRNSLDPVAQIADRLGFGSRQAFMRWFRQHTGLTPGEFRRQSMSGNTLHETD